MGALGAAPDSSALTRAARHVFLCISHKVNMPIRRVGSDTKAADDLVGSFAIISLAIDFAAKARKGTFPFLGILTRAEEVGWIGAIAHLDLNWTAAAKRPVVYVSLETSRQLPGAMIGQGPIVRLGDRYHGF